MSALADHIASYQERNWQVYELPFDADMPQLAETGAPAWANSDTSRAAEIADDPGRLYPDLELLAAGCDPSAGGQIGRLAADWQGHNAGVLVICTYEKISEQKLVFLVELP